MKTFLLACCLLWVASPAGAQSKKSPADSLKVLLGSHPAADTIRVNLLLNYIGAAIFSFPDSTLFTYINEAITLSRKTGWRKGEALALQRKGVIYSYILSDYVKAMTCFQEALRINQVEGNKSFEWGMLNNIAVIYFNAQLYDKSLDYYRQAMRLARTTSFPGLSIAQSKGNMAEVYAELHETDSALLFFNSAIDTIRKYPQPLMLITYLGSSGEVFKRKKEYAAGEKNLLEAIRLTDSFPFPSGRAISLINLALIYVEQGKASLALPLVKEAQALTAQINTPQWQSKAWEAASSVYYSLGQYKASADAFQRSIALNDSVINDGKKLQLGLMETNFAYEKKEAVLNTTHTAALEKQKTLRYIYLVGATALLLAAAVFFWLFKRRMDAKTKQTEAELKAEISDTEMKALRAQMNPHFIFNSLNSISDYMARNNTKVADVYLTKFARLMRLILENSEQREVPLQQDLKALELYMQLEALRMNDKFTYQITVDASVDADSTLVPPLILQPFVENSIWHGIAGKTGHGKILVHITKEGSMINCSVEDDGIGRSVAAQQAAADPTQEKKSMGMKITKQRIDVINKLKQSAAVIHLFDLAQGTRVEVKLPLETSF